MCIFFYSYYVLDFPLLLRFRVLYYLVDTTPPSLNVSITYKYVYACHYTLYSGSAEAENCSR